MVTLKRGVTKKEYVGSVRVRCISNEKLETCEYDFNCANCDGSDIAGEKKTAL